MNNSVIFEITTQGFEESISSATVTNMMEVKTWTTSTNAKRVLALFNADRRVPKNWAGNDWVGIDGDGFTLMNSNLSFATGSSSEEDWIGMLSVEATNSSGTFDTTSSILICTDDSFDLDKGLSLFFPDDGRYYDITVKLGYQSSSAETPSYHDTLNIVTSKAEYYTSSVDGDSAVNRIYIQFNGVYSDENSTPIENVLFRFYGLSLGYNAKVTSADIVGDIVCYGEFAPQNDDVPIGTCELNCFLDEDLTIGQVFRVYSDQYEGKYNIDTCERQKGGLWTVSGVDDMSVLDQYTYTYNSYGIGLDAIEYISNVKIENLCTFDTYCGWLENGQTTCRQWLAEFNTVQADLHTCFNCSSGIKTRLWWIGNVSEPTDITEDKILGEAIYRNREKYTGLKIEMTVDVDGVDTELSYSIRSKFPKPTCLAGWYTNKSNVFLNRSSTSGATSDNLYNTARRMYQYLNGPEVEATIVYEGQELGDFVNIPTPNNGTILGVITSIDLHLNHADLATIKVRGTDE